MKNIILIIAAISMLFACKNESTPTKETVMVSDNTVTLTEVQYNTVGIQLAPLESRTISSTLKLNGKIDVPPQNMISVSMPLGGFLKSTSLLPGMFVKKGEVLATMEDQQYIQLQQDYLTAKSKLMFVEQEYNRQKELNQSKANSDKVFQQAELNFKTQRVEVSALAEKLKLIHVSPETLSESSLSRTVNIYSSIEGYVSKVNVNIGKYVNPTDVLFELVNPSDIHLNLQVFEKDLSLLSVGQKVLAYTNNRPDSLYTGEIILISRDLSSDRTAEVHCHFEHYDKALVPGMYMNADVVVQSVQRATLQNEAIVSFEGKEYVFVKAGDRKFQMVEVKKGNEDAKYCEITFVNQNVMKASQFVVNGAYSLLMQLKNKEE